MRQLIFNLAVQSVGRVLLARDIVFGWASVNWRIDPSLVGVSRHRIASGKSTLDAVQVRPEGTPRASVLLCHGIGETVQRWFGVQRLLATQGVSSLVFNYSGYGRSKGWFSPEQVERDAVAAFRFLEEQVSPMPVSLLGLSLGSAVVTATLPRVNAKSLVLCAAFTSIRDAAHSIGIPRWLGFGVPPIWRAADVLAKCDVPVLVVHGERDRLFPVAMARELATCCATPARVIVVPGLKHNDPFHHPTLEYWGQIVEFLASS